MTREEEWAVLSLAEAATEEERRSALYMLADGHGIRMAEPARRRLRTLAEDSAKTQKVSAHDAG